MTFKLRNTDRLTREKYKLNLEIPKPNQATFGTRSLSRYGPKIWNAYHIKTSDNLNSFQSLYQMLGWKPLYLQSLRTYNFKTTDSHKNTIL